MAVRFDHEYFMDEVRDGFLVTTMIKRLWAVLLKDYSVLQDACEKLGINCCASMGSLIGAVRTQGMIPWDDDLDLDMKRVDYLKLCKHLINGGLPSNYWFSEEESEGNGYAIKKFVDRPSLNVPFEELMENYGFPFASLMDVFMIDFIPEDEKEKEVYFEIIEICDALRIDSMYTKNDNPELFSTRMGQLQNLFGYPKVVRGDATIHQVVDAYLSDFLGTYDEKCGKEVYYLYYYLLYGKTERRLYTNRQFKKTIRVPYEGGEVSIPAGYDGILRSIYEDYMVPYIGAGAAHEYPCYRFHMRKFEEAGLVIPTYHYEPVSYDKIRNENKSGENSHRIVFLCYKAEYWKSLHTLWLEAVAAGWDVKAIAIPYYYKDYDGRVMEEAPVLETDLFPKEIELTSWQGYSFETEQPDVVVYQCPYDGYSDSITLPEKYYSENVAPYAGKMVFIPPYLLNDEATGNWNFGYTLGEYLRNPGTIYADMIFVQSEKMSELCNRLLTEFTTMEEGGESDICWNDRIFGIGVPEQDWKTRSRILIREDGSGKIYDKAGNETYVTDYDEVITVSSELMEHIRKPDGTFKKILLFYVGPGPVYEYGSEHLKKEKDAQKKWLEHSDEVVPVWLDEPMIRETISDMPDLKVAYDEWVAEFKADNRGLYADEDTESLIKISDMYYGDASTYMNEMRIRRKPIFWVTPERFIDRTAEDSTEWTPAECISIEGKRSLDTFMDVSINYSERVEASNNAKSILEVISDSIR